MVALSMIVKDEFVQTAWIVKNALEYFDEINLVVSDEETAVALRTHFTRASSVFVTHRPWNDKFDDARNACLDLCESEWVFWLDADDSFDFSVIPKMVAEAEANNIDAVFLPYNYAQDDKGNCITYHWRERLIRRTKGFRWRGWVHETLISDELYTSVKLPYVVTHKTNKESMALSLERNHKILEKAYAATNDPRYLHYLGMSFFSKGDYNGACETLSKYLEVSGSVEDTYRALCVMSESAYHLKEYSLAAEYATKAAVLTPEYPMAYWLLAQYEADQNNWQQALEWLKVGETKPDPDTLAVYDPTSRERAVLIAAQAYFMLGEYREAYKQLSKIPNNDSAAELIDSFRNEAEAELFVELIPKMRRFFKSDLDLWSALCADMKYDTRLRPLRHLATKPKTWSDKSIVIFCGQGYEEWGPHTLDKGMGGSEEAVVYLSRELAKLGYDVTVFGEAEGTDSIYGNGWVQKPNAYSTDYRDYNGGEASSPVWLPWKEIDTRDEFNVFISWRAPQYLEKINAKVKIADIHDVLPESVMKNYPDVTYFLKTEYHRSLSPKLEDKNIFIVGNGIVKEQF